MTEDEEQALYEELEADLQILVQAELDVVAQQFAAAVEGATELVAAVFSVSRIADMWQARVPRIMTALRRLARRSATVTAEELGEPDPDDEAWDAVLIPYQEATKPLIDAVGDNLARAAVRSLNEGVAAGEDLEQLKSRMLAVFDETGVQLGPVRSRRIAQTEANRSWNAGVQAAAEALSGPARPLVKQWRTLDDDRVRRSHRDTNGQLQLLADPFDVDGFPMQYPGDPAAPADLTVNCRCRMRASAPVTEEGTPPVDGDLSAAADVQTGAMIALVPSEADAARLALKYGEPVDQLHLTLFYLGDADQWPEAEQEEIRQLARVTAAGMSGGPVHARAFGVAQWNPAADEPAWVWNVGDDNETTVTTLRDVHDFVTYALEARHGEAQVPPQYTPWAPHICGVYTKHDDYATDMAERCGPVTFDRIRVAFAGENWDYPLVAAEQEEPDMDDDWVDHDPGPTTAAWSTPDGTALAFENQQTGDGRIFAPDALYWEGDGGWPLQYADEMQGGHDGARLAGVIADMRRDGDRLTGEGVLYLTQGAGWEAAQLLAQGAPLGVSVDLDDVDVELVDASPEGQAEAYRVKLLTASVLPKADGGWWIDAEMLPTVTASAEGSSLAVSGRRVTFFTDAAGRIPAGPLTAAAGDTDVDGVVVDQVRSGDFLMRITRGRVRGATLVSIPAYANARIVLEDPTLFASLVPEELEAAAQRSDRDRVIRHVRAAKGPVGAANAARTLGLAVSVVKRYLAQAAQNGDLVRLARGLYTDHSTFGKLRPGTAPVDGISASVTGAVDLPVAGREVEWDGDGAKDRVFTWADGDPEMIAEAFAYLDDEADPLTKAAWKLGYADVLDGTLVIIPRGVSAALGAMSGARGGVDLPEDQRAGVTERLEAVQRHVDEELGEDSMEEMEASAWQALEKMPAMPAAWFREPTAAELPPGGQGVNYSDGRIFGWVAQANEPHAGFGKRVVINELGKIDTTHFLRRRKDLDDGTSVKVGAFTMNVGHHRDGAECETSACQFDDTRTVAGVITVGMNERGMWFSGAAAPWLSEWDREVFATCQPSYHMKKGSSGRWELRAVLSVPVPGHSSPLLASAVIERSQMALTAAASMGVQAFAELEPGEVLELDTQETVTGIDYDRLADSMVAAMARAEERKAAELLELAELMASAAELDDNEGI